MIKRKISRRHIIKVGAAVSCALLIPGTARAANIHQLTGTVYVNKKRAREDSVISAGDLVTTSHNGRISFAINGDAFLLKERTSLRVGESENPVIQTLRLLTGKLLGVFETGRHRKIVTANATIGIRGTACFLNASPRSLYYCNCYGETELKSKNFSKSFSATHHNAHQLEYDRENLMEMQVMKVIDHTDDELRELEALVGRVPLFDRREE